MYSSGTYQKANDLDISESSNSDKKDETMVVSDAAPVLFDDS